MKMNTYQGVTLAGVKPSTDKYQLGLVFQSQGQNQLVEGVEVVPVSLSALGGTVVR